MSHDPGCLTHLQSRLGAAKRNPTLTENFGLVGFCYRATQPTRNQGFSALCQAVRSRPPGHPTAQEIFGPVVEGHHGFLPRLIVIDDDVAMFDGVNQLFEGLGFGIDPWQGGFGVVRAGGGEVAVVVNGLTGLYVGLPLAGETLHRGEGCFANGGIGFKGNGFWAIAPPQSTNHRQQNSGDANGAKEN